MTDSRLPAHSWPEFADFPLDNLQYDSLVLSYRQWLESEQLPTDQFMLDQLDRLYLPMAQWLLSDYPQPSIIGIHGAQGSGKSTLAAVLELILREGFGCNVITLSIDDLYLDRESRQQLAHKVHPLLRTRGVPGTHDTQLGMELLDAIRQGSATGMQIPRFDKASDNPRPVSEWPTLTKPVDFVLFEGWCVGSVPQQASLLDQPVNELEQKEDRLGSWRRYVNQRLASDYQSLFSMLDCLVMLSVPSFDKVYEWRKLQEKKLRQKLAASSAGRGRTMSNDEVRRFIMHYERITRHSLEEMPARADLLLQLDDQHRIDDAVLRRKLRSV